MWAAFNTLRITWTNTTLKSQNYFNLKMCASLKLCAQDLKLCAQGLKLCANLKLSVQDLKLCEQYLRTSVQIFSISSLALCNAVEFWSFVIFVQRYMILIKITHVPNLKGNSNSKIKAQTLQTDGKQLPYSWLIHAISYIKHVGLNLVL